MALDRITVFCIGASYACALVLEFLQLFLPWKLLRVAGLALGGAGLLAHTAYLFLHPMSLSTRSGSMLFLAWILATFYLYGSIHHRRFAWGVFVLPLVFGLTILGSREPASAGDSWLPDLEGSRGERFWGQIHGGLLLLAAVGVCVGFLASVMYLVQAQRLKAKALPGEGMRLLSLERLEEMNRRAINLAFPLLTAGVFVGVALMIAQRDRLGWRDPKIISTVLLWLAFAILLYVRHGLHVRGRRLAFLTIAAFGLLLVTLASAHTTVSGGSP
jgi:ABC-type transport system involved in cytochrome c biogenesis permease subunit